MDKRLRTQENITRQWKSTSLPVLSVRWLYLFALGSDWFVELPRRYWTNIWV